MNNFWISTFFFFFFPQSFRDKVHKQAPTFCISGDHCGTSIDLRLGLVCLRRRGMIGTIPGVPTKQRPRQNRRRGDGQKKEKKTTIDNAADIHGEWGCYRCVMLKAQMTLHPFKGFPKEDKPPSGSWARVDYIYVYACSFFFNAIFLFSFLFFLPPGPLHSIKREMKEK